MAPQFQVQHTPESIAQAFKPNWRVVSMPNIPDDAQIPSRGDASMPEVDDLLDKYFGNVRGTDALAANNVPKPAEESVLVNMEPPDSSQDNRVGRKAFLIQNGQVTGEQG